MVGSPPTDELLIRSSDCEGQTLEAASLRIEDRISQTDWRRFYGPLSIPVVMATLGLYWNSGAVVIAATLSREDRPVLRCAKPSAAVGL